MGFVIARHLVTTAAPVVCGCSRACCGGKRGQRKMRWLHLQAAQGLRVTPTVQRRFRSGLCRWPQLAVAWRRRDVIIGMLLLGTSGLTSGGSGPLRHVIECVSDYSTAIKIAVDPPSGSARRLRGAGGKQSGGAGDRHADHNWR